MDSSRLKVHKGDPLRAEAWNSLVDQAYTPDISAGNGLEVTNTLSGGIHISLTEPPKRRWIGKIVTAGPSSEADYSTEQYWVQMQYITNSGDPTDTTNVRALVNFADVPTPVQGYKIVTATNINERIGHTHNLAVGQFVWVYEEYDAASPTTRRFLINSEPFQLLTAKVVTIWSAGTNIIQCIPVHPDGSAITGAVNLDIFVEFPTGGTAQYCGYQVDDVVGYFLLMDGSPVLFRNKLPMMTAQYQGWFNNASSGVNVVADFARMY